MLHRMYTVLRFLGVDQPQTINGLHHLSLAALLHDRLDTRAGVDTLAGRVVQRRYSF
jgi:hypothetical protein